VLSFLTNGLRSIYLHFFKHPKKLKCESVFRGVHFVLSLSQCRQSVPIDYRVFRVKWRRRLPSENE
jgi:hypothetical protein